MKKHFQRLLACGTVAALLFAGASSAMASMTGNSDAEIQFQINTNPNALALEAVPELDFGLRDLQVSNWYYSAIATTNPLEVHDGRGAATGWNVTVSLDEFEDSGSTVGLQAAEITFKALTTYTGITVTGTLAGSAGITGPTAATPSVIPTTSTTTVTAAATPVAVKIFSAPANTGVGMWAAHWMPDTTAADGAGATGMDVELLVKAGTAAVETYTANMNWTLADAP